jgi:hypothetical protein
MALGGQPFLSDNGQDVMESAMIAGRGLGIVVWPLGGH